MKKIILIAAAVISLSSCSVLGGLDWNAQGLASAASKAATAASISDDMVVELSRQTIASLMRSVLRVCCRASRNWTACL